ncbi:hypothetical protein DPMN_131714 [Dreissena polymorpha]|uniref:Uncharacterized protein n=1 Tax=Dreissena polymorpha TaxID=45954 RepID=A0A9D4FR31_DREPO|nr:hypothetical protein DPMN_131714 [Dreissena polymorpha]
MVAVDCRWTFIISTEYFRRQCFIPEQWTSQEDGTSGATLLMSIALLLPSINSPQPQPAGRPLGSLSQLELCLNYVLI